MSRVSTTRSRRALVAILAILALGATACSPDDSGTPAFSQTIKGEGGSRSSVKFGPDAEIPSDFPSNVPLPDAGELNAIVAEKNPPNASFTMTFSLGGRNGSEAGDAYRNRLQRAGFKIKHYSSVGGSDGDLTQFDAVGKKWDVAVVSGKANLRDRKTMSVQVYTHGQITSGLSGIGDTTPDTQAPTGTGVEIPDPDASTTTTTTDDDL